MDGRGSTFCLARSKKAGCHRSGGKSRLGRCISLLRMAIIDKVPDLRKTYNMGVVDNVFSPSVP